MWKFSCFPDLTLPTIQDLVYKSCVKLTLFLLRNAIVKISTKKVFVSSKSTLVKNANSCFCPQYWVPKSFTRYAEIIVNQIQFKSNHWKESVSLFLILLSINSRRSPFSYRRFRPCCHYSGSRPFPLCLLLLCKKKKILSLGFLVTYFTFFYVYTLFLCYCHRIEMYMIYQIDMPKYNYKKIYKTYTL